MSDEPELPLVLQSFIIDNIKSVEQLEILLLIYSQIGQLWTPVKVSQELRSSEESTSRSLEYLTRRGVLCRISEGGSLSYSSFEEWVERMLSLSFYYKQKKFKVIEQIFLRPSEVITTFADAFRLKKNPNNG